MKIQHFNFPLRTIAAFFATKNLISMSIHGVYVGPILNKSVIIQTVLKPGLLY